jgi:prepilin-type processing-associated H-X9-DG protein
MGNGYLVEDNAGGTIAYPCWTEGDMSVAAQATNLLLLQSGLLYPLNPNPGVYKCPDDKTAHLRSYSMQPPMAYYFGGVQADSQQAYGMPGYPPMYKDIDILNSSPSTTLVFLDENPNSINDSMLGLFIAKPQWWDYPASWHSRGCNMDFADGHAEHWRWLDSRTITAVSGTITVSNVDLEKLQADLGYK